MLKKFSHRTERQRALGLDPVIFLLPKLPGKIRAIKMTGDLAKVHEKRRDDGRPGVARSWMRRRSGDGCHLCAVLPGQRQVIELAKHGPRRQAGAQRERIEFTRRFARQPEHVLLRKPEQSHPMPV